MEIILTHEQADFDAIGALLGAYLLNEHAVPVLPRRVNRNVRAFLDLYGIELPFIEFGDLPSEPIDSIILVDTQSMSSIKGVAKDVRVCIVDHHPLKDGLPDDWDVRLETLGATTTLFVEQLTEHNGNLNVIHATLLMLGIYEDTGALTYQSTTSRDVRAAAVLMENGANLGIANEFLNPPLSADQHRLYNRMLESAESLRINEQVITLCHGNACDMDEEISSVAHKLRDLLDPDGLILLASTHEGIRLVARSSSGRVNVAGIASHFNGGGHERAAAALIHPENFSCGSSQEIKAHLEEAYLELKEILPAYIRPPITVKQIMSTSPTILSPETSAQEAAELMQQFGYEGYPVAKGNQIIGLLNRRAVDRALAHKLEINAASLMEVGEVHVHPGDSLETLQRVMTSSGWGQVPVLNESATEIIGIVTRTDLLKTLNVEKSRPVRQQNFAVRLDQALPGARLALLKKIAQQAHDLQMAVYVVGGFVRDLMLQRPSLDFDVVVEGDAITLAKSLSEALGGRVISHKRFGTAKWWIEDIRANLVSRLPLLEKYKAEDIPSSLDLISARTEFYTHPTALPTVKRGSIKLDLHRRDFTINTLALRLDGRHYGELYDYWGGLLDIQNKLVRVLHSLSFIDDPTRMLRAVRFEQRFKFEIETRTLQLIEEARPLLKQVSAQRLRHELDLILEEDRAGAMLSRLDSLNLLQAIHPLLSWNEEQSLTLIDVQHKKPGVEWKLPAKVSEQPLRRILSYQIWFAKLQFNDTRSLLRKLRFPGVIQSNVLATNKLLRDLPKLQKASPSEVVARLENVPPAALYSVWLLNSDLKTNDLLHRYITTWQFISPFTDGNTLRSMGLKPGPIFKQILTRLRAAWLDGKIQTPEAEKTMLELLIQELRPPTE